MFMYKRQLFDIYFFCHMYNIVIGHDNANIVFSLYLTDIHDSYDY